MNVTELSREELMELKSRYYTEHINENASYGELADIDSLVSDNVIFTVFAGVEFRDDDFFCNS